MPSKKGNLTLILLVLFCGSLVVLALLLRHPQSGGLPGRGCWSGDGDGEAVPTLPCHRSSERHEALLGAGSSDRRRRTGGINSSSSSPQGRGGRHAPSLPLVVVGEEDDVPLLFLYLWRAILSSSDGELDHEKTEKKLEHNIKKKGRLQKRFCEF